MKIQNDQIYDIDLTLDVLTSNNDNKQYEVKNNVNSAETIEMFDQYRKNEFTEKIKEDPNSAENFEEINLHDSELSLVNQNIFKSFRHVRKLILSFNNLTSIKDISYLVSNKNTSNENSKVIIMTNYY